MSMRLIIINCCTVEVLKISICMCGKPISVCCRLLKLFQSGHDCPAMKLYFSRVSSQERTRSDSRGSSGSSRGTGRDEKQLALDTVRRLTSLEKKQGYSGGEKRFQIRLQYIC